MSSGLTSANRPYGPPSPPPATTCSAPTGPSSEKSDQASRSNLLMTSTFQDPAVQSWLSAFEADWDEGRLAARAAELPPPGHPNRLPLLTGMVAIDLRRRWRRGKPASLESYLASYPELGTAQTAPLELLQAEYEARLEAGVPADVAEFARRFGRDPAELAQRFQPTQAGPRHPVALPVHESATLA